MSYFSGNLVQLGHQMTTPIVHIHIILVTVLCYRMSTYIVAVGAFSTCDHVRQWTEILSRSKCDPAPQHHFRRTHRATYDIIYKTVLAKRDTTHAVLRLPGTHFPSIYPSVAAINSP